MDDRLLIDSGPSAAGASYYGTATKCRMLFALKYRLVPQIEAGRAGPNGEVLTDGDIRNLVPAGALTFGSMLHTGLAHALARAGAVQAQKGQLPRGACYVGSEVDGRPQHFDIDDPDQLLNPDEAVVAWTEKNRRGEDVVEQVLAILDNYLRVNPEPPGLVVGVECEMHSVLGDKLNATGDSTWGLWLTDGMGPVDGDPLRYSAMDGREICATPLDAPGHPKHGLPIEGTRRADAVFLDPWQGMRGAIVDHKSTSSVDPGRAVEGFKADLGFGMFWHMGRQAFTPEAKYLGGEGFSGVYVNLIGKREPYRIARAKVPLTTYRNQVLPRALWDTAHEIARLDLETMSGERTLFEWPMAQSETVCSGRYGLCGGHGICFTA